MHEETAVLAYRHIFGEPFPRAAALARWSAHEGPIVLASCVERTVGFAARSHDLLDALYVLPGWSGRGIGTRLLEQVGPVARLWVLEQNAAGRAFYERRGWTWSGQSQPALDGGSPTELLYVRA